MIYINGSTKWASLESKGEILLSDFLNKQHNNDDTPGYIVDFSIARKCKSLLENIQFRIPRYVKDKLQNIGQNYKKHHHNNKCCDKKKDGDDDENGIEKYVDHWPSLFIGKKNTKSGLHIDSIGSFWQLLLNGSKKWIIFDSSEHYLLQPDMLRRTFSIGDNYHNITRWEVILEPGDLILVPSKSAHAVINTEDSIAMAGNFVDNESFNDVVNELKLGTGIAPGYKTLLDAFQLYEKEKTLKKKDVDEDDDILWVDLKENREK